MGTNIETGNSMSNMPGSASSRDSLAAMRDGGWDVVPSLECEGSRESREVCQAPPCPLSPPPRYMKYLYPYECEKRGLSNPNELQAAIDSNRREGRRQSFGGSLFAYSPGGAHSMLSSPKLPVSSLGLATSTNGSSITQAPKIKKGKGPHEPGGSPRSGRWPCGVGTFPLSGQTG